MTKAHSYEYIEDYFRQRGCRLISTTYKDQTQSLKFECFCGTEYAKTFIAFKTTPYCRECHRGYTIKKVRAFYEANGCELLTDTYKERTDVMKFICSCGKVYAKTFLAFKTTPHCDDCNADTRLSIEEVQAVFAVMGYTLQTTEYRNSHERLSCLCSKGHNCTSSVDMMRGGHEGCRTCSNENRVTTNMERRGVEYPSQDESVKAKTRVTNMERRGFEWPMQDPEVQDKARATSMKHYDVPNPMQSKEVQAKFRATNMERRGVEWPMQDPEVLAKSQKSAHTLKTYTFSSGETCSYQGYEKFCIGDLLKLGYSAEEIIDGKKIGVMPEIWYYFEEKFHRYFPDFFIEKERRIIEVKSDWTLNKDYLKNLYKAHGCVVENYSFEFWIYDRKGNLLQLMGPFTDETEILQLVEAEDNAGNSGPEDEEEEYESSDEIYEFQEEAPEEDLPIHQRDTPSPDSSTPRSL